MSMQRDPRSRRGGPIPRLARFRAGRWAPLLLLVLSLGIAGAAVYQAQGAVRSHRATAEGLLRDYAAFAAWSYRQAVAGNLNGTLHQALEPVWRHADLGRAAGTPPPVEVLLEHQRRREAEQREKEYGFCSVHYGAPYYFRLALAGGAPEFAGSPPREPVQRWIADAVPSHALTERREGDAFSVISARVDGATRHLVYAVLGGRGESGYAYGFEFVPERYEPVFEGTFRVNPLLPTALMDERSNAELLLVRVRSPGVGELFASDDSEDWRLASADTLSPMFGGWVVEARVRPEVAGSLIIGGLPRSRLPFLVALLALSVALAAVAIYQLRREGELARLRSDFVSSVSHELRTPLAQVRLFLETLRLGRYSTDAQREWILENMDRETTRLTGLVDNVLHFSRAERGNIGGDLETVELDSYLRQVVEAFAPLTASRGVRLVVDAEPGLHAPLHPESFRQVLLNLLDNAVKYGPAGQTVRVTARARGERVRIAVEDEGPGIDPRERERIWEPFRRGERAIGSVAVGSGIGLAVVREIVSWHGGRAWVEGGAEGGARFVLEVAGWRDGAAASEGRREPLREAV